MTSIMITLLAVLMLAFGLHASFDIRPRSSPVTAIALMVDISLLLGMAGHLKAGCALAFCTAAAVFCLGLYRKRGDLAGALAGFLDTPVVLFIISSVMVTAVLSSRQPVMNLWDEFSFWGMSAKLTKLHDAIYTMYPSSMLGISIPPALPVMSYLFMSFSGGFIEWGVFAAYDVFMLAAACCMCSPLAQRKGHVSTALFITGALSVFIVCLTGKLTYMRPVYMTAYSDMPMALCFAACLCAPFFSERNDGRNIPAVLPVLLMLTFIKDMGFALGCIAVFVMFFYLLFAGEEFSVFRLKRLPSRIIAATVSLGAVLASFLGWSAHLSRVAALNRTDFGGSEGMSMFGMLFEGAKQLLIPSARSDKFRYVLGQMLSAFFSRKVFLLGSGAVMLGLVTALFLVSFLACEKKDRPGTVSLWVTLMTGFTGYYVFHIFLYVFVFRDDAYTLASYERYMQIYYEARLLLAARALARRAVLGGRLKNTALAGTVLLCALCTVTVRLAVSPDTVFTGADELSFSDRLNVSAKVEKLEGAVSDGDVIYFTSSDLGGRWFIYSFELTGCRLVPDWAPAPDMSLPFEERKEKRQGELREYLEKNGVTHILVDNATRDLCDLYGDLFDTEVGYIGLDAVGYYRVEYSRGSMRFITEKEVRSVADQV